MAEKSATAVHAAPSRPPVKTGKIENLTERINRIHNAIARRAFEIFERDGRIDGNDVHHWLEAEQELLRSVPISMEESESEVVLHAEVPGFTPSDLEVNVEPRCVTIAGKHRSKSETKGEDTVRVEERSEEIFRSVELASEVNLSNISATLKDGLLTIQLPKVVPSKSKVSAQQAA